MAGGLRERYGLDGCLLESILPLASLSAPVRALRYGFRLACHAVSFTSMCQCDAQSDSCADNVVDVDDEKATGKSADDSRAITTAISLPSPSASQLIPALAQEVRTSTVFPAGSCARAHCSALVAQLVASIEESSPAAASSTRGRLRCDQSSPASASPTYSTRAWPSASFHSHGATRATSTIPASCCRPGKLPAHSASHGTTSAYLAGNRPTRPYYGGNQAAAEAVRNFLTFSCLSV